MKFLMLITILFSHTSYSQNSQISGTVFSNDSTEVMPFTTIKLISNTDTLMTYSDSNGKYKLTYLAADKFELITESIIYGSKTIAGITLTADTILYLDVYLVTQFICNGCTFKLCFPKLSMGDPIHVKLVRADLKHIKTIQIEDHLSTATSDIRQNTDKLTVRGCRTNNITYYVDGIRQRNTPILPRSAINSMRVHVGGLPAKFGDTTSGVISVSTTGYFDLYYDWKAKQ